jgi:hypothetical protein
MSGREHHHKAHHATTTAKSSFPSDEHFAQEHWLEFERLIRLMEEAIVSLHQAAHQAAEAHQAHAHRASQRVERRAAHLQQAGEHVHHTHAAVTEAHAATSQHEEGTEAHTAAVTAHTESQAAHTDAQAAHEHATTRHKHAQEAHENATHHAAVAAKNRDLANSMQTSTAELMAALALVVAAASQLPHEASLEDRAQVRGQHQGSVDRIKSHLDVLDDHLRQMEHEVLDEPEDDSAEDRD